MKISVRAWLFLIACLPLIRADDGAAPAPGLDPRVAATVDGKPIYLRQVTREIKRVFKDRPIDPAARDLIEAQTLEQLVRRRLILRYLESKKLGVSEIELTRAQQRVEKQLGVENITLEQFLTRSGLSDDEFRDALSWQIGWKRYLDRYLTDENLKRYFDQHRRQFDGTQLRVSHILIKLESAATAEQVAVAERKLREIRREIQAGKLSFADAARRYSQAATGKTGGAMGLISRHEPMPEGFSDAAFALEKGSISPPVRSKFGLHLIQCVDIVPGEKQWTDVKRPLEVAVTKYLFDWVSEQQRPDAQIQFEQGVPHFEPGKTELAD